MPRKKTGWGTVQSLSFGRLKPVSQSKGYGAPGNYPSERRYGTTVTRSVVEKYDMDSDWSKWRKGYEYYLKAAYRDLVVENEYYEQGGRLAPDNPADPAPGEPQKRATLNTVLYQGTPFEQPTLFYGWEFSSKTGDENAHYVVKREMKDDVKLGTIDEVWNNPNKYTTQKENREIWVKGKSKNINRMVLYMEGDRITDKETEATLKCVLNGEGLPASYTGKTFSEDTDAATRRLEATKIKMKIPLDNITVGDQKKNQRYVVSQGLRNFDAKISAKDVMSNTSNLVGKVMYVPAFFQEKPFTQLQAYAWEDAAEYFGLILKDKISYADVVCLDSEVETLPPSMYDMATLPSLFKANNSEIVVEGTYIFQKSQYNKYYPNGLVTASDVEEQANDLSYGILPFTIESAYISSGSLIIDSVPFASEVKVHPGLPDDVILVFTDHSFCKYSDKDEEDEANKIKKMYTDVQPWQDEVFTSGNPLEPAPTYTCSCPDHSHSIIAAPQAQQTYNDRKQNRQRRYPLPSVQGLNTWEGLGVDQYAGKFTTWETAEHKYGLRLCKHAIAARFIEDIHMTEPSKYPSYESRLKFEEKLQAEVKELSEDFHLTARRSQLSVSEIVFSLAQGLNLNGIETAYAMFQSS